MSTQAIQAGEAFIQLNIKSDDFQNGLLNISDKLEHLGGDVKKFTSLMNQNFSSLADSLGSVAPMIQLTGVSFSAFSPAISLVENLTIALQNNIVQIATMISEQGLAATVSHLYTSAVATSTTAVWANATAFYAHPIMWIAGIIAGVTVATVGLIAVFDAFTINAEENANAMEELCKQNDSYRDSAQKCMTTLEEFSKIESLDANQKKASLSNWNELQRTAEALKINLDKLGITFNEHTGKVNASAQALADFKEAIRQTEIVDLDNAIQAEESHLDDLNKKLQNAKTWSWRSFGTYVTFGYVDNAEEIQNKINERREKLQDNLERQKVVVDFSAEYKENEAKLQEIYDKEKEAAKNALAVKLDAIHQEIAERRALLNMLIAEASAREDTLTDEEKDKLNERRAALKALKKEEKERVAKAKKEDDEQVAKIETDYFEKRKENEENTSWKKTLESDPNSSLTTSEKNSKDADQRVRDAVAARRKADENTSKKELERLNDEIKEAQKEADKWYARREEAAKKVAEIEKKSLDEQQKRLQQIDELRNGKQEQREKKKEQEAWKEEVEFDSGSARVKAKSELDKLTKDSDSQYAELQRLAKEGTSEQYQAQLEKVRKMEEDIDLWQSRIDEIDIAQLEASKKTTSTDRPSEIQVLKAGTTDAQKKFLELQQGAKNPMEAKFDITNGYLARIADSQESFVEQVESL